MPPAAQFLPTAEEMGERTPPKTNGFWISFRPNVTTVQKGPQRIASASTLAAAGVVGREHLRFYRFEQLSNRALTAAGKCRCGRRGAGGNDRKRCKALSLYRTNGEISPVERGSGSGNVGDSGLCLRRPYFFRQRKGMFRALGHGSLLAAAPKVTKNAA